MDNAIKELEGITRLMDFAEESLNQINNRLQDLTTQKGIARNKLSELEKRASELQAQLAILEVEKRVITASRPEFRI